MFRCIWDVSVHVLNVRARGIEMNPASGMLDEWGEAVPLFLSMCPNMPATGGCGHHGIVNIILFLLVLAFRANPEIE